MKVFAIAVSASVTGALAMTFTGEGIAAMLAAGALVLGAIFTGIANLIRVLRETKSKVEANTTVVVEAAKKTSEVLATTEKIHEATLQIHTATDGTLHLLQANNKVLEQKVTGLEALVASMVAGGKAQALAVTEAGRLTPPVEPAQAPAPTPVLQSIEQNAAATAENTRRTDAAVADLKDAK